MRTSDFDFSLPRRFIAERPSEERDGSRLLVLHRDGGIEHRRFADIADYLNAGDMLLLNNTKVFPARIIGTKPSGGKIDILLVRETDRDGAWRILCKGRAQGPVTVLGGVRAEIRAEKGESGETEKFLEFTDIGPSALYDLLWRYGCMPLPPYIRRKPDDEDKRRYQTVYAEKQGSIAAPTAGLHFTGELLGRIEAKGVAIKALTLHVGSGTFKPVKAETLDEHLMDPEYFEIDPSLPDEIRSVKGAGRRLITVGTTATRAIEGLMSGRYKRIETPPPQPALAKGGSRLRDAAPIRGCTDIFIRPGYEFRAVDSLITNFHLPRSTPLMLVAAISDYSMVAKAYKEAIAMDYRFFSYGDAMLIL